MAVKRKTKTEEPTLTINEEQEWGEEKIQKYRNMKRKLIEVIAVSVHRTDVFSKLKTRLSTTRKKTNSKQRWRKPTRELMYWKKKFGKYHDRRVFSREKKIDVWI